MADMYPYAVILVQSLSYALKAERLLEPVGIPYKLIPVPRNLSSQCGICVRILRDDRDRVLQILNDAQLEIVGVHEM